MIAIDTSALMAIALNEPQAVACMDVLVFEDEVLISAGTLAEALIVSARRNVGEEVRQVLNNLRFRVVDVSYASALRAAEAYERWGKGRHPARLNFGDCFAYEVAKYHSCRLLYVGRDFSQTDIEGVL